VDEQDRVWVGVHFGSRGLGHKTATAFLRMSGARDGMDVPPCVLELRSEMAQDYLAAMQLAGRYAYAGREYVCRAVAREILRALIVEEVHNHHNFAWKETHDGQSLWVVRKGATPAFPGQKCFVGGSMGDNAVILEGVDSQRSRQALYSTVHGAGRVMSRTAAAGKVRWVHGKPIRQGRGAISEKEMHKWMQERGIVLRGGGCDEAPQAYRRLDKVLKAHEGTVKILHTLRPIGVAMAGADVFDPYKD
jgi:tRNA-splicing ligase RtcB